MKECKCDCSKCAEVSNVKGQGEVSVESNINGIYLELANGTFKKTHIKYTPELAEDIKLHSSTSMLFEVNKMIMDEFVKELNHDKIPITDIKAIHFEKVSNIEYIINKKRRT